MKALPPALRSLPGLAVAAALGAAATVVTQLQGGPQMLYALFFGVAFNYLSASPRFKPGVDFATRTVLRWGVALLGVRVTAEQVMALGWQTAAVVMVAVAATIGFALWFGARLGLPASRSVLAGGAVAICGASAALAIAAVLPRDKEGERFTLMVVVAVTLLSTAAMVLYPALVHALALTPALGGLFLGGTIHDVAQVVGAGYSVNPATGDTATVVKLFRVALLTAVVGGVAFAFRDQHAQAEGGAALESPPLLPWFLWLFIALVALNSTLGLAPVLQQGLAWVSRACLVLAIAALGMKTSFSELARMGWRPLLLIGAATLWLAGCVLVAVLLLR